MKIADQSRKKTIDIFLEAEKRVEEYIHKDILKYQHYRNYDYGPSKRDNVSNLSKYFSHRVLFEFDVLQRILDRHEYEKVSKFTEEIFWRIYWKGWLENRPQIWEDFIYTEIYDFNKTVYEQAVNGSTNITCFNNWVKELKDFGYLHNHARMWFASIWIFTLKLPWQLGCKFFMRYLLDGDAASNTLSWRWVAGLQTKGKNYLARSWNIKKYTGGRFDPHNLDEEAGPLQENVSLDQIYTRATANEKKFEKLVLFETDLFYEEKSSFLGKYKTTWLVFPDQNARLCPISSKVYNFKKEIIHNFLYKHPNVQLINQEGLKNILSIEEGLDVSYPFVGEQNSLLQRLVSENKVTTNMIYRKEDLYCWQYCKKGFFNFKKNIPTIIKILCG